ncbi:MAG TPA: hypothetical protein DCE55_29235 [Planctomycetaceae bacterium]|nr:hypothetical protein [Planctomycetaceae bacterium]|tara:strand:+ start:523 stop:744 length:222 start_codon:yes stop_codon:yes gene_type:complete
MSGTELLKVKQLADRLQLTEMTVYDMARRGQIPFVKVGKGRGNYRFVYEDVLEALREDGQKQQQERAEENAAT